MGQMSLGVKSKVGEGGPLNREVEGGGPCIP